MRGWGADPSRQARPLAKSPGRQPCLTTADPAAARGISGPERQVSIQGLAAFTDMASVSYRLGVIAAQAPEVLFRNLRSRYLALNDAIAATVAGQTHIRYLDKLGLLCDRAAQRCDLIGPSGKPIIYDSAHMTLEGIDILGARIRAAGWFE